MTRARPSIPFLLDLLELAVRKQASAVYVVPWMPPTLRIDEQSVPLSQNAFSPEQTALLVRDMLDEAQRAALDRAREVQFALLLPEIGRFRVHAFRRHGQPAMAIRPFSVELPAPATLALPLQACHLALADRGLLVLASRSPTLRHEAAAALIGHRNQHGQGELALLDDASLYWHEHARCRVRHGMTAAGVDELLVRRSARPATAPDAPGPLAVLWGELRDASHVERVLRSAVGALAVVTLDAGSLVDALHRLVQLADETGGADTRRRLGLSLYGVLAMRPVPAASGGHELAATEVLLNSPELAANLAEGDLAAISTLLASPGATSGGCGTDEHLWQLVAQGLVAVDDATRHAVDRDAFVARTTGVHAAPAGERTVTVAAAPVTVDTAFADIFDQAPEPADAFAFAESGAAAAGPAETQFDGVDWNGVSTTVAPTADGRAGTSAELREAAAARSVQFHAWAPKAALPGGTVAVDIWAALPDQADTVATQALRTGGRPPAAAAPVQGAPFITLQLRVDGLLHSAPTQRLAWQGRPDRVRFNLALSDKARPGAHAARVKLSVGGLPLGELGFVLHVSTDAQPVPMLEDAHAARRMLHTAYAAYSPVDREQVAACVDELHQVAPGLEIFLGAPDLRHDAHWRERIEREVARRERLFLFWSQAAAESPWVDFEWRLTMRRRGPTVIDTVLLEPPRLAPLPPELSDVASIEVRLPRKS